MKQDMEKLESNQKERPGVTACKGTRDAAMLGRQRLDGPIVAAAIIVSSGKRQRA